MSLTDKIRRRRGAAIRSDRAGPRMMPEAVRVSIGFDTLGSEGIRTAVALAQAHGLRIDLTVMPSREFQRLGAVALWGVLIPGEIMVDEQLAVLSDALTSIPSEIPVSWRLRG